MMRRWIWGVLLAAAVAAALMGTALAADPANNDGWFGGVRLELNTAGTEWTVVEYDGKTNEVVIPALHLNKPITKIAEGAFSKNPDAKTELKKVTIPGTITSVGKNAFKDCISLNTVTFQDYTSIEGTGRNATIAESAFHGCNGLLTLTLSSNITEIQTSAFRGCSRLLSVVIPKGVNTIAAGAFGESNMNNVTFLDTATNAAGAFNFDQMTTIHCLAGSTMYKTLTTKYNNKIHIITTGEDKVTKKASCKQAGEIQISYTCTFKNEIKGPVNGPDGKPTGEQTVVETKYCELYGNKTQTESRTTSILPHTEVDMEDVPSTCQKLGTTGGKKCSVCGTVLEEPTENADLAPHTYTGKTFKNPIFGGACGPAGMESGGLEHILPVCDVCGKHPECTVCEGLKWVLETEETKLEAAQKTYQEAVAKKDAAEKAVKDAENNAKTAQDNAAAAAEAKVKATEAYEEAETAMNDAKTALDNLPESASAAERAEKQKAYDDAAAKADKALDAQIKAENDDTDAQDALTAANEAKQKAEDDFNAIKDVPDSEKQNVESAQTKVKEAQAKLETHAQSTSASSHFDCDECKELKKKMDEAKKEAEKETAKTAYIDHLKETAANSHGGEWDADVEIQKEEGKIPEHKWGKEYEIITVPPICGAISSGKKEIRHTCEVCGEDKLIKTESFKAPKEHEPDGVRTVVKEPTCTEPGEAKYPPGTKCKICGQEITDSVSVPALGHDLADVDVESTVTKEPTCEEPGERLIVSGGKRCQREGCDYVEPGSEKREAILPLGHKWGDPVPVNDGNDDVPPTCGGTGKAFVTVTCSVCGKVEKQTIEIAPTEKHTWGDWVVTKQPTYTEPGSQERTCSVCGKKDTREIPALGECEEHDYGEWVITKQPTATEDGSRKRVCKICGHEDIEKIPATGEEPVDPSTKDFTIECIQPINGSISAPATAKRGTTVTVTFSPHSGYELDQVQVTQVGGGYITAAGSGSRRAFTMPASNVEIRAVFSKIVDSPSNWSSTSTGAVSRWTDPSQTPIQDAPRAGSAGQLFYDVPSGHWASGEIAWASQMGYMAGDRQGAFNPDGVINYQQMWTVLARISGYWPSDMADARRWAVDNGYAEGANPTVAVTRSQVVTALYRSARLMGGMNNALASLTGFTDSRTIPSAARNPMAWAVANGIISGTSNGRLNPNDTVTRAQFAVFLYRFNYRA